MKSVRIRENAPHRLIVEGQSDLHTVIHLTKRHGWDWDNPGENYPYIAQTTGDRPALEALSVAVRSYSRVGLVLDADIEPIDRWRSVCDRVATTGYALPELPNRDGTIAASSDGKRRLGIWLMPDNQSPGKLEDFLAVLVPSSDPCWPWSGESTEHARDLGAKFKESDFIKARIHTWLAWQSEPGLPFGTAIKAATFDHDTELAHRFVAWMNRLFD
jgi:hypothetical protein